jgi:NAD(P)-dependent dehydrogenase (short-subunit alcohol dehydrogenase family)
MKVWLITGCSGGFGKILAHRALARGDRVVVTARNLDSLGEFIAQYPQTARAVELDVTRAGDAERAVSLAEKEFGRLDVLVNNAGHGMIGAIEEGTPAEYRPLFETNVFGLIETTRAALPLLRRQRGGRVVNLSSGAGLRGTAGTDITMRRSSRWRDFPMPFPRSSRPWASPSSLWSRGRSGRNSWGAR